MHQLSLSDLIQHTSYINGRWVESSSKFSVINPADETVVATVDNVDESQVKQAIEAAEAAQKAWRNTPATTRASYLKRWHELILEHQNELASLLTQEQGKPLVEAKAEIAYGASYIEWFAEEGKRAYGDIIPSLNTQQRIMVLKQPIGVVAAITPWNFPNAMITRKVAAALAAGCSIVVKPSEITPLSALALAKLAEVAGLPAGVFNVVVGTNANGIGRILTDSNIVKKLSFTGSTHVGKTLMAQCATTVKKLSLELGGNAPFIVFDDADIEAAVDGAIAAKYRNAGQTCICANRFYVHRNVHDVFVSAFQNKVSALRLGNGLNEEATIGPLINQQAMEKVNRLVTDAKNKGATVIPVQHKLPVKGHFVEPLIITGVSPEMDIMHEEIFGPVSPIVPFDSDEELLESANATEYGLAAYFYTKSFSSVWHIAESLDFGMVGINEGILSNAAAPFGGIKQSGFGREGSKYGLDDYLNTKYLCMKL